MKIGRALIGHGRTLAPYLLRRFHDVGLPRGRRFVAPAPIVRPFEGVHDVHVGGELIDDGACESLVIVVHGLGGSLDSYYTHLCAKAALDQGHSVLRLLLRGADRRGGDFYHAGLREDLDAALAASELARFRRIFIVGYSLGGHITLRWCCAPKDERVVACAAVCPPLDLGPGADHLDQPSLYIYRRHLLSGLKDAYRGIYRFGGPKPASLEHAMGAERIRDWDDRVVAPRYGFESAEAYYTSESAGPKLASLACPTLLVIAPNDPMIPFEVNERFLADAPAHCDIELIEDGGHVGFPAKVPSSARFDGSRGVEAGVMRWFGEL